VKPVELFTQIASNRGALLRCEGQSVAGREQELRALRLTFDLGVVKLKTSGDTLVAEILAADAPRDRLVSFDEAEPWWKLLGHPLNRVVTGEPMRLVLQWRADSDGPKRVELRAASDVLHVRETP
jgi:hypothetical protein